MKFKNWQDIIEIQDFIELDKIDSSLFVADLDKIRAGKGIREYFDPVLFFDNTYLTKGLTKLFKGVLSRLLGISTEGVYNLQTSFGGGKTHALAGLFHFFNSYKKLKDELIFDVVLKDFKSKIPEKFLPQICTIVGANLDVNKGRIVENNIKINTLWGELAYQLGGAKGYKIIELDDKSKTCPTKDSIKKLFLSVEQPSLILMDEVLGYISNLDVIDKEWLNTTFEFFRRLPEIVNDEELKVALIISLPESRIESQTERGEARLLIISKMIGREESIIPPIEGEEIYHIIRKRLFKPLSEIKKNEITKVCNKIFNLYKNIKFKNSLPDEIFSTVIENYEDKLNLSYPFHPELIKVFYEKWNASEAFQRTRYILNIFSLLLRNLKNDKGISLILPGHFSITEPDIKSILLKFMGQTYESVIDTDIKRSRFLQEEVIGEDKIKESKLAEKLFRVIFLHSFQVGTNPIGINEQFLNLSVLDESGIIPALIELAREKMKNYLFYFFEENGKFLIKTEINLNAIIIDEKNKLKGEEIDDTFKSKLNSVIKKNYQYIIYPSVSNDIPDKPAIIYIICDSSFGIPLNKMHSLNAEIIAKLLEFTKNIGQSKRVYKNGLIFILPEIYSFSEARDKIKELLALEKIEKSDVMNRLSSTQKQDLKKRIKDSNENLNKYYYNTYSIVCKWDKESDIKVFKASLDGENLQERAEKILISENVIFESYFSGALTQTLNEVKSTEGIWNQFFQIGDILLKDQNVLIRTIIQGIQREDFAFGKLKENTKEEDFSKLKTEDFKIWYYQDQISKSKITISNDTYLIPSSIVEQIIKNSIEKPTPTETPSITPSETPPPIPSTETPSTTPTETPPTTPTEPLPTISPETPQSKPEELNDLKLTLDFSWENLDLLMNLKTLLLMLGQKSESLKIKLNIDFKASTSITGMNLSNIKKLIKELSDKIEDVNIESDLGDFLN